jgi:hypothetical protein
MPSYDALHYDPPAPIAQVALRTVNGVTVSNVLLLLDTGADTTLLPNENGGTRWFSGWFHRSFRILFGFRSPRQPSFAESRDGTRT